MFLRRAHRALTRETAVPTAAARATFILESQNAIYADTVTIGGQKCTATLAFNPAFTNSSPQLFLRGFGPDRVSELDIGDFSAQSVSGSTTAGTADFSGGMVDVLADTIFVGKGQTSSGTGATTGTLTLNSGTLDVNTLEAGYQNATNAAAVVTGTVNVNGTATVVVNSMLRLAHYTGSGALPVGTLNIGGGTVSGDGDIVAGGGTSAITVNGGVLGITGSVGALGAPVGRVALTNASLQFSMDVTATNLVATSLVTGGSSNLISVISLPAVFTPTQIPLIDYSNAIAGAGFNFILRPRRFPAAASARIFPTTWRTTRWIWFSFRCRPRRRSSPP